MTGGRKRRLALMAGESGCRARTRADFLCVQVSCYVQSYSSLRWKLGYGDETVSTGHTFCGFRSPFFSKGTDLHSPNPAVNRAETVTTAATREIAATDLPW